MTRFFHLLIGTAVGLILGLMLLAFIFTALNVSTFRDNCDSYGGVSVRANPGWICVSKTVVLEVPSN